QARLAVESTARHERLAACDGILEFRLDERAARQTARRHEIDAQVRGIGFPVDEHAAYAGRDQGLRAARAKGIEIDAAASTQHEERRHGATSQHEAAPAPSRSGARA